MDLQSASASALLRNHFPITSFSSFPAFSVPSVFPAPKKHYGMYIGLQKQTPWLRNGKKSCWKSKSRLIVRAFISNSYGKLTFSERKVSNGSEPLQGKPGSVSFRGLTHLSVAEGKLLSSPISKDGGSIIWILAPIALISSLVLPQFFIRRAIGKIQNKVVSEFVGSLASEVIFYMGLAMYILVTENVQKPYLEFSSKRWSLITGLKGYLVSVSYATGFKICVPLLAAYVTWPVLGLPALVSVAPFLLACLVQYVFKATLESRGSSCWPLVPIIFEVYRIYQLTNAVQFMERLILTMKGAEVTPVLVERHGALVFMIVAFQVLGVVSLWSLVTFLQRLIPSRPVAQNY